MGQDGRLHENLSKEDKGKGKGKEAGDNTPSSNPDPPNSGSQTSTPETSVSSRVLSSAAQLASQLGNAAAVGDSLREAMPTPKAGSSSSRHSPPDAGTLKPLSSEAGASASGSSFKMPQDSEHTVQRDSEFSAFLDNHPKLEAEGHIFSSLPTLRESTLDDSTTQKTRPSPHLSAADGAEVVNLLQSSGEAEWLDEDMDTALAPGAQETLQATLFRDDGQREWGDMLNFFPDFLTHDQHEAERYFGTTDLRTARDSWVNQWQGVLTSYTDTVWGDLGPLIAEARDELQALSSDSGSVSGTPKALRRLQQILGQIRGF